jgi:PEP-CTERM motif
MVNTGGITLTAGSAYVALLTLQMADDWGVNDGNNTLYAWETTGHVANDGGGGLVFDTPADGTGGDLTNQWTSGGGCYHYGDAAWTANFTPGAPPPPAPAVTPEPSSLVLLGTGILGFAGLLRGKFMNRDIVS